MPDPRRRYSPSFKEQAVEFYLAVRDYRTLKEVAEELGVHFNTLRRWVEAVVDERAEPLGDAERDELLRLRAENRILKEELEISKKAAAFFATETRKQR
jgi:transposase